MLIANVEGAPAFATATGQRGTCTCGAVVMARVGRIVTPHWAHPPGSVCSSTEPETPWHMEWKKAVSGGEVSRCERAFVGPDGQVVHRADAIGGDGSVVEVQHSPLAPDDLEAREAFYTDVAGAMCWVFDYTARAWPPRRGDARILVARAFRLVDTGQRVLLLLPRSYRAFTFWSVEEARAVLRDEGVAGVRRAYAAYRIEQERLAEERERLRAEAEAAKARAEEAYHARKAEWARLRAESVRKEVAEREAQEAERRRRDEERRRVEEAERVKQAEWLAKVESEIRAKVEAEKAARAEADRIEHERARARREQRPGGRVVNWIETRSPEHPAIRSFDLTGSIPWMTARSLLTRADSAWEGTDPAKFPPVRIPPEDVNVVGIGLLQTLWPYLDETTDRELRRRWRVGSSTIPRPPPRRDCGEPEVGVLELFGGE